MGPGTECSVNGVHMSVSRRSVNSLQMASDTSCAIGYMGAALSLERCDLTCEMGAVVYVGGEGTTATISNCCIHDGKDDGVFIGNKAAATLANNDIHSNTSSGVRVMDEGSLAVLRGNRIHGGGSFGVDVSVGASATLENNDIHSNARCGVLVEDAGAWESVCLSAL